jgi:hypothetical protein
MSSTRLRDEMRKKNNFNSNYTDLDRVIMGTGLLLAGQNVPSSQVNTSTTTKSKIPKEPNINISGTPDKNRYMTLFDPKNPNRKSFTKPKPNPNPSKAPKEQNINISGTPNKNRYMTLAPKYKRISTRGGPIHTSFGQAADLMEAAEAGDITPFLGESASAIGRLMMGLL